MKVRQLNIANFRGIRRLDWTLPVDQRLISTIELVPKYQFPVENGHVTRHSKQK